MKKIISFILALMLTMSTFVLVAFAGGEIENPSDDKTLTIFHAVAKEICQSGKAELDIQFKETAPVMDGKVSENEYFEIPYAVLQDYYTYYVKYNGMVAEELLYQLEEFARNDMTAYACWDGQYFYFALVATAKSGSYVCPPDADGNYMYRYCCMQCGFAAPDATEKDRFEVGLAAPTDDPNGAYFWGNWGNRQFANTYQKGVDYCNHWDSSAEEVTYEIRVNIKEVTGAAPEDGSQMRFTYLLSQSGQGGGDGYDRLQIQCSYGIAREKMADWFLMLNFKGLPEDVTVNDDDIVTEEELPGFFGKTNFRTESNKDLFDIGDNAEVEFRSDDNGDKYVRITATGSNPYAGGKKLPGGMYAPDAPYLAIRYRLPADASADAAWLGISYNIDKVDDLPDDYKICNDDELGRDGQWHTVVFDVSEEVNWITYLSLWPCAASKNDPTGSYIDVMWMKYYSDYPEFDDVYEGSKDTTVADTTAIETEADTTAAEAETTVSADTTAAAAEVTTAAEKKSGGCGGTVAGLALIAIVGSAIVFTGKKH